jgi:hypothetical protein
MLPQVYADFQNADARGRLRLNCVGTINDLSRQRIELHEGLGVMLYDDNDADEQGRPARLVAQGTVAFSAEEHCWVASIDWDKVQHEPKSAAAGANGDDRALAVAASRVTEQSPPHSAAG